MTGKPDIQEAADPVRDEEPIHPPDTGGRAGSDSSFPAGGPEAPVGPTSSVEAEAEPETDHERQLEHDLEELTAKAEKADEYLELAQRTKADFENYRKRARARRLPPRSAASPSSPRSCCRRSTTSTGRSRPPKRRPRVRGRRSSSTPDTPEHRQTTARPRSSRASSSCTPT